MTNRFAPLIAIALAFTVGILASAAAAEKEVRKMGFGDACAAEGNERGTEEHGSCVADKIAAHCAVASGSDTTKYKTCIKSTNSAAFTRDMMGRYGH